METIYYAICRTPWVSLLVASSAQGLLAVRFIQKGGEKAALASLRRAYPRAEFVHSPQANQKALDELEAYVQGRLRSFTVPLDLRGRRFQRKVWSAMRRIPFGETKSYAAIARTVGRPKAFRAVGVASRTNPLCIVIPCHRVIGSDGDLCGFGGGLKLKRELLDHEQRRLFAAA